MKFTAPLGIHDVASCMFRIIPEVRLVLVYCSEYAQYVVLDLEIHFPASYRLRSSIRHKPAEIRGENKTFYRTGQVDFALLYFKIPESELILVVKLAAALVFAVI